MARAFAAMLAGLALLLMAGSAAMAQFSLRSSINGRVTDTSGAVVPGATVTLLDLGRNQTSTAQVDAIGLFAFKNLNPGQYQLTVKLTGFQRTQSEVIALTGQTDLRVDLTLKPGGLTEAVFVQAEAPLLRTEQPVQGAVIDRHMVENLPVRGRNFTAFAVLAPNISSSPRSDNAETWAVGGHHLPGGADFKAGGGGDNAFVMDGTNINENWVGGAAYAPSIEAIDEVSVNVTAFSAQNGRDVANLMVTGRSGNNTLHGAVYDYAGDDVFKAWDPLVKANMQPGQKKDDFSRHQFGANLGGPVVIPGLFNGKDKVFFFVNYERMHQRHRGTAGEPVRVPTARERQGDFGEWLERFPGDPNYILYNPYTTEIIDGESSRTPIPNNDLRSIPGGIDPRALEMLNLYPAPNWSDPHDPTNLNNYQPTGELYKNTYRLDTRLDFRLSSKDNLFLTFHKSHGLDDNRGGLFPQMPANIEDSSILFTANYARTFRSNLVNEAMVSYRKGQLYTHDSSTLGYFHNTNELRTRYFNNLGFGDNLGVFAMGIDGYPTVGPGEVFMASNPTFQISDNLTWILGNHTLKAGFNYFRTAEQDWDIIRTVNFSAGMTNAGSLNGGLGGNGLATFLMGIPSNIQQVFRFDGVPGNRVELYQRMPYAAGYLEDSWRATPKLTLNVGLRYDLGLQSYSPISYGNAWMDTSVPGWELKIPGRAPGVPLDYLKRQKNAFAPRLSVSYQPRQDIQLRAAYGIFYNAGVSTQLGDGSTGQAAMFGGVPGYVGDYYDNLRFGVHPDLPYLTLNDVFPPLQTVQVGTYPVSTGPGSGTFGDSAWQSITFRDPAHNESPNYHRYMAQVQKSFGSKTVLSLSYVGTYSNSLQTHQNLNLPPYRTGWTDEEFNAARPNNSGSWGDVLMITSGRKSVYNAGTIMLEQRLTHGVQVLAHYTYSKQTEDYESIYDYNTWTNYYFDWNKRLSHGESPNSHPHRAVVAVTYQVPELKSLSPVLRTLLGDWTANAIYWYESGDALTIINAMTSARDHELPVPNLVGDPNLPRDQRSFLQWFNTAAFADPGPDVKGNAGLGIVRGPAINNLDLSLGKIFPLKGRSRLELRLNMFNALNHTQWSSVDTYFTTASGNTFGRPTEAREPRIMNVSLKVSF